ncbi:LOW QUALITY PROTEIN: hypothetical protein V2J09_013592 [Rumex salicifolius]
MLTIADLNMGSPFTMVTISSAGPLTNKRGRISGNCFCHNGQLVVHWSASCSTWLTIKWLTYLRRLWAPPVFNLYDGVFVSRPALEIVGGCYL